MSDKLDRRLRVAHRKLKHLEKRNTALELQIDRMRNCQNCDFYKIDGTCGRNDCCPITLKRWAFNTSGVIKGAEDIPILNQPTNKEVKG